MGTLFSTQKEKSPAFQKYINYQLVIGGEGHLSSDLYTFSHSTNTLAQCVLVCQTSCSGVEGGGKLWLLKSDKEMRKDSYEEFRYFFFGNFFRHFFSIFFDNFSGIFWNKGASESPVQ